MNKKLPLKIIFLNVKHGDGIIVLLPRNEVYESAIIIDCNDGIKAYKVLEKYNIKFIESVVITHFHSDHYKGFDILFNRLIEKKMRINNIFYYPDRIQRQNDEGKIYKSFLAKIVGMAKDNIFIYNSNIIDGNKKEKNIYKKEDLKIDLIYPRIIDITSESNINNYSGIVEINYRKNKVLLTGDLEESGWFKLYKYMKEYQEPESLNADIIKMPHHGAFYDEKTINTLGTNKILELVKPKYAIISTADTKKYNHPNIETIKALRNRKIRILCTNMTSVCKNDCECFGDISIEIDDEIKVENYEIKEQKLYCVKNFKNKD